MWIMGIGWGKLLSIWEFIIPASAGLSDELKTSVAGGRNVILEDLTPFPWLMTYGEEIDELRVRSWLYNLPLKLNRTSF
jgi:hypothetical protein